MEQTLGKRIMTNRKRLGLTQDQLAEKLGVTAQAVSKWENDQSCPDITILPQLADIFGISTDVLLGRCENKVYQAEIVTENDIDKSEDDHHQENGFEFTFDGGRTNTIWTAILVLGVGALYLLSQLLDWGIGFWDILWPTALLIFGVSGLHPKFSFFRLACGLFGGYFLAANLLILPAVNLDGSIIFAICVLLFGLSLMTDALKKPKKSFFHVNHKGSDGKEKQQLHIDDESFDYKVSFSSCTQPITIPCLRKGAVQCTFGEYKLDLSGVEAVHTDCIVEAKCSFGELTLLVPSRFAVKQNCSTAFADISAKGQPSSTPDGVISLNANASFGEIVIEYI